MAIKHAFVSALPDDAGDAAAGLVVSSNWNADHDVDSLTLTHGTITADENTLGATVTWNNAAVTFTALELNVTDTASASASLLLDLQIGGTSKFYVDKSGNALVTEKVFFGGVTSSAPCLVRSGNALQVVKADDSDVASISAAGFYSIGGGLASCAVQRGSGFMMGSTNFVKWSSTTAYSGTGDVYLYRDAAAQLAQRNNTNAQTFRVYGTYTDSSNYVRAALSASTTAITLAAETAGTGADNIDLTLTPAGTGGVLVGAFFQQFTEMTAPAAPAANGCRIYAVDNGAGKTQLMALFASGAAQQLAIEP